MGKKLDFDTAFDKAWWERHLGIARESAKRGWEIVREVRDNFEELQSMYKELKSINEERRDTIREQIDVICVRGRTITNLVRQCEELVKENERLEHTVVVHRRKYPAELVGQLQQEINRLQRGIEYFAGELDKREAVISAQRGREPGAEFVNQLKQEIEDLRGYVTRQTAGHKIELEGQRGAYLMAIDEITKLRQILGQKLVNAAEALAEADLSKHFVTDTPGPGGEVRR